MSLTDRGESFESTAGRQLGGQLVVEQHTLGGHGRPTGERPQPGEGEGFDGVLVGEPWDEGAQHALAGVEFVNADLTALHLQGHRIRARISEADGGHRNANGEGAKLPGCEAVGNQHSRAGQRHVGGLASVGGERGVGGRHDVGSLLDGGGRAAQAHAHVIDGLAGGVDDAALDAQRRLGSGDRWGERFEDDAERAEGFRGREGRDGGKGRDGRSTRG